MTREQAIRKLKAKLGPKAYWRVGEHVSSPEKRRAYSLRRLNDQFVFALADRDLRDRTHALQDADPTWQQLNAERRACYKSKEDTRYRDGEGGYRFEVGTRQDIFTHPRAYGDTWEEVFAKLDAKTDPQFAEDE